MSGHNLTRLVTVPCQLEQQHRRLQTDLRNALQDVTTRSEEAHQVRVLFAGVACGTLDFVARSWRRRHGGEEGGGSGRETEGTKDCVQRRKSAETDLSAGWTGWAAEDEAV